MSNPAKLSLAASRFACVAALCGCLAPAACLTPSQTRSVETQIDAILRQAEGVRSDRERIGDSLDDVEVLLNGEGAAPGPQPPAPVEESVEADAGAALQVAPRDRFEPPSSDRVEATTIAALDADPAAEIEATSAAGLEAPPNKVPEARPGGTLEAPPGDAPAPATMPATGTVAASSALFREGYALFHRRDYQGAERVLRSFLDGSSDGSMADDARYWIGECRFARGMYRDAILEYQEIIDRHPGGNRVPHAYYRIALSHERLGEQAEMRRHLAVIADRYPESDIAPLARARLD